MLDKAHKRLNVATQAAAQNNAARPVIQRGPSFDAKRADEQQRRLQADLENERKVKADLMANLKQVTTANESAQALLAQELSETRAQRDGAIADLDDLQEEMDILRSKFLSPDPHEGSDTQASGSEAQEGKDAPSLSNSTGSESRLTPDLLRTFATQLQSLQEQRMRKVLLTLTQHCPEDMINDPIECDAESLEMQLCETLDASLHDESTERDVRTSAEFEVSTEQFVLSVSKSINDLIMTRDMHADILYKSVPATFQDIFTLLNRTLSFTFPEKPLTCDATSRDSYQTFLANTDTALSHTIRKYITSHQKSRQKISYRAFAVGDLALFLPTRNANSPAWAAFNVGAPHYFLAMDGVDTDGKDFLIGRIQDISEKIGEPGIESMSPPSARLGMPIKKWWEVKISEKKKVAA
ncbi:protein of unknown function [Taphrina deformans PYCC 5710]|uniref:Autophagy-related protein 11 n=1 Tax=Taphrina deformans (strain PYCC 5710 / ATCC 11124 / CBS 356.35 / IMI 108563 / JCM 9778 / NBRC 8474) TaxID=1097556 RepID=R4XIZ6_TAPDE|nr:protein of unknown function [Taphrina deformans PYCC 5710]|eukprot:CCG84459.1 protein of unknown function [Taphrina deformans PYCC 5710]